jgi:hypothetical protein
MRAAEFELGKSQSLAQRKKKRLRNSEPEQKLDELSFLGSPCTKDCSGHRAGYDWSARKGNITGNSPYSPSFNNGANLRAAGK